VNCLKTQMLIWPAAGTIQQHGSVW